MNDFSKFILWAIGLGIILALGLSYLDSIKKPTCVCEKSVDCFFKVHDRVGHFNLELDGIVINEPKVDSECNCWIEVEYVSKGGQNVRELFQKQWLQKIVN